MSPPGGGGGVQSGARTVSVMVGQPVQEGSVTEA